MSYIEVKNAQLSKNDPRHHGRFPHKATIILVSAREKRELFFMDAYGLERNRVIQANAFLNDVIPDGDFTSEVQNQTFKGKEFPTLVVCCRDLNWIMMAKLMDHQWMADHTYMVESI